jgi:hypothetical protein
MVTAPNAAPQGALNSWKEIAGYLGKSPRTVQRWERELGLPIRRILTPDGGAIVFALPTELEAWRAERQQSGPSTDTTQLDDTPADTTPSDAALSTPEPTGLETPQLPAAVEPLPPPARRSLWSRAVPAWFASLAAIAFGALGLWVGAQIPASGVPATWEHDGRHLRTFTQGGRQLWSHDFGRPVTHAATFTRDQGYSVDVNGDSVPELIVPVRYAPTVRETSAESDAVVAFDRTGRIVWRVQPTLELRDDSQAFHGPWYAYDVIAGVTPEGPRTWVAFNHHTWWPGFVVEVDPQGRQRVFAMVAGRIHGLTFWRTAERGHLVVAGALRSLVTGTEAAGLFLDVGATPVSWPAEGADHLDCEGCPSGDPLAVIRLPASHVERALVLRPAYMFRGKETPSGLQLPVREQFGRGTIVTVTATLQLAAVDRTDLYWTAHTEHEAKRLIGHEANECPDRTGPMTVFRWSRTTSWAEVRVAPSPEGTAVSTDD